MNVPQKSLPIFCLKVYQRLTKLFIFHTYNRLPLYTKVLGKGLIDVSHLNTVFSHHAAIRHFFIFYCQQN